MECFGFLLLDKSFTMTHLNRSNKSIERVMRIEFMFIQITAFRLCLPIHDCGRYVQACGMSSEHAVTQPSFRVFDFIVDFRIFLIALLLPIYFPFSLSLKLYLIGLSKCLTNSLWEHTLQQLLPTRAVGLSFPFSYFSLCCRSIYILSFKNLRI